MRLFAFHTDWSRIFQPCISCAAFSSPAFSTPAIFFVPNFHVVHFSRPFLEALYLQSVFTDIDGFS